MVTWACRQFDIAQLFQLSPYGRFRQRNPKFVMKPPRQVDQPPTHNPMDRWYRSTFNDLRQRLALDIIQQGRLAWGLAVKETRWTSGVEPHHPIPHDLQGHSADARGIAAVRAIIDFRQS